MSGLILMGMIMHCLVLGYVIPAAQCDLELTTQQKGWLSALPFTGKKVERNSKGVECHFYLYVIDPYLSLSKFYHQCVTLSLLRKGLPLFIWRRKWHQSSFYLPEFRYLRVLLFFNNWDLITHYQIHLILKLQLLLGYKYPYMPCCNT